MLMSVRLTESLLTDFARLHSSTVQVKLLSLESFLLSIRVNMVQERHKVNVICEKYVLLNIIVSYQNLSISVP